MFPTTLTPAPIRLHPTPAGYLCYGDDAEAAAPILGVAVEYAPGDFVGRVTIKAGDLADAIAELNAARETVSIVEAKRAA